MAHFAMNRGAMTYVVCQIIVILFFGLFTEYKDKGGDPHSRAQDAIATKMIKSHYASF